MTGAAPRPSSNIVPLLLSLVAGVVLAAGAAAAAFFLHIKVTNAPVAGAALQTLILAGGLWAVFRALGVHSPGAATLLGLVLGLASAAAVHAGLYVRHVYIIQESSISKIEQSADQVLDHDYKMKPEERKKLIAHFKSDPYGAADEYFYVRNGEMPGLPGYMVCRAAGMVEPLPVFGPILWTIWVVELFLVAGTAAWVGSLRTPEATA